MKEKEKISFMNVSKFSGYKKEYAKTKIIMEREFNKLGKKDLMYPLPDYFRS